MARRKMINGICHLCKKTKDLSFEHIPPKAAFNKNTKYRSVPFIEYVENSLNLDYKPSAKAQQGGLGSYCLCQKCNSFLGTVYVPSYETMAKGGRYLMLQNPQACRIHFEINPVSPSKLLKQVVSMFININEPNFTDTNPELLSFVKDPKEKFLSERYRIFMYLNREGKIRSIPMMVHSQFGLLAEITFPPLGFVLSIDSTTPIPALTNITHFKNVDSEYFGLVKFQLNILPTHLPFVADYRTEEEIEETIRQNEAIIALEQQSD